MNDFVNPKNRSIQLPNGAKDLADVLHATPRAPSARGRCDYCGAPAVTISICCAIPGVKDEEVDQWCDQCVLDLREFADRPENIFPDDLDDAAIDEWSRLFAERKRREEEFMRQKVRDRKSQ